MDTFETGGARIVFGASGEGEPLVLIPGFASGIWNWKYQAAPLAEHFKVITFDPRGVAGSANNGEPGDIGRIADDVVELLEHLRVAPAHILGISFGGFVTQEFARRYPEKVRKLVLCCTSLGGASHVAPAQEVLMAFASTKGLNSGDRIRQFLSIAFRREFLSEHADLVEDFCSERERNFVPENAYLDQLRSAMAFDMSASASKIGAETLILTGDSDTIVPTENSRNLAAALPNATLRLVADAGHMFFIERAEEFNRSVIEFLTK